MRIIVAGVAIALAVVLAFAIGRLSAQERVASCRMCPSTYIPRSEIAQYEVIGCPSMNSITRYGTPSSVVPPSSSRAMWG